MVNAMPKLLALDSYIITDEERTEDASFGNRFRIMNEYMLINIPPFPTEPDASRHIIQFNADIYSL